MAPFDRKKNTTVLVAGGAGFIGSHVNKLLDEQGFRTIVLDNLSHGSRQTVTRGTFIQGDIANRETLEKIFRDFSIDAVMHFAALIDVGESMADPAKYYINNVAHTLNLLEAMRMHGVKTLVFSSTAAIYGVPQHIPINESHPCHPINPYGATKLMTEQILQDYDRAYGIKSSCLRYFNAAGGDPEGEIKNYKSKESNLIPLILRSLQNLHGSITIFGTDYPTPDGTCIRDYIHVNDLGIAHILAMQKIQKDSLSANYNLGNGNGFSVLEVIRSVERVTGKKVNVIAGGRRPGDPAALVADPQKALRELDWRPKYSSLDTMVAHAWQALQK